MVTTTAKTKDPVCGMDVDEKSVAGTACCGSASAISTRWEGSEGGGGDGCVSERRAGEFGAGTVR
jgi:hypothetical protein